MSTINLAPLVEDIHRTFTGTAYALTLFCGLLTIMVERFLYVRRRMRQEAVICAAVGWTYVIGGTLLYFLLLILSGWL